MIYATVQPTKSPTCISNISQIVQKGGAHPSPWKPLGVYRVEPLTSTTTRRSQSFYTGRLGRPIELHHHQYGRKLVLFGDLTHDREIKAVKNEALAALRSKFMKHRFDLNLYHLHGW